MSPYRVLTEDRENNRFIHIAMLSPKGGDPYTIYILNKWIPMIEPGQPGVDLEAIAYKMNTKLNSSIVDRYFIHKVGMYRSKYKLTRGEIDNYDGGYRSYVISSCTEAPTQAYCMVKAMEDYCNRENLRIIKVF